MISVAPFLLREKVAKEMTRRREKPAGENAPAAQEADLEPSAAEGRHKGTEQLLATLSSAVEQTADHVIITDTNGVIEYVNRAFEDLTGYSREEAVGKTPRILKSGQHGAAFYERLWKTILSGDVFRGVLINRTKDGRRYYEAKTITPIKDRTGRITHFVSTGKDITELQKTRRALQRSEEKHSRLLAHIDEIVYLVVAGEDEPFGGRVEFVSRQVERVTGYPPEAFVRDPGLWPRLVHPDDIAELELRTREILRSKKVGTRQYRLRNRGTGTYRWMEDRIVPETDAQGNVIHIFGVARDVTERKLLEAQLRHAQKMEAVGRLAGGLAHDFNNLLTGVIGYAEFLLEDMGPHDSRRHEIQQIARAGRLAAGLTRQLLAFSRGQMRQPVVFDLNAAIVDLAKFLPRLLGEDVEMKFAAASEPAYVKVDPIAIKQVIMNLAINARDAMPGGGTLTIETANVELDEAGAARHADVKPGSYVMLAVSDTGTGMDPETRARIFEPFFTTKEQDVGTGLGLSTAYGIIKQSGGHIDVDTAIGKGTTFRIYLPRSRRGPGAASPQEAVPEVRGGSETILVVEDEEVVRGLARRALERYGYRVLVAADGEQALRLARQHPGRIHLLLADVVMPRISGPELAARLADFRPGIRVLFMSGHAVLTGGQQEWLPTSAPLLGKPFTARALAGKVREVLDLPSAEANGMQIQDESSHAGKA